MELITKLHKKVKEIDQFLNKQQDIINVKKTFYFAIPLKSKKRSKNWNIVQRNLQKTLRSILNNTKNNYQVIIAGHEKPSFEEINNPKITWITANFPVPSSPKGFNKDKKKKLKLIGQFLKSQKSLGYIIPFDADDIVHYRFIEYLNNLPIDQSYLIKKGLMCNFKQNDVWLLDHFYLRCGSGGIHPFNYHSFPNPLEKDNFIVKLITSHIKVVRLLRKEKIRYQFIEHPLVLRTFGHSDNNMLIKKTLDKNVDSSTYYQQGEELSSSNWINTYFKSGN